MKEFKYLRYRIQRNGEQVRERVERAATVMGQVWGIGKRRFGKNWGRRLFDVLVWSYRSTVMSYRMEV